MNELSDDPILPQYLANYDAQCLARKLSLEGEHFLRELLKASDDNKSKNGLIANEIVAASIGHPFEANYWSYFAEEWLFRTGFVADLELVALAQSNATRAMDLFNDDTLQLRNLAARLSRPVKKGKRRNPGISAKEYKKMVRSFSDNIFDNGSLYGDLPNVERAIATGHFRGLSQLAVGFPHFTDKDSTEAFKILLLGSTDTLEMINVSCAVDRVHVLSQCIELLEAIKGLEYFESQGLRVDDDVVRAATKSKVLRGFRSTRANESFVTSRGVSHLLNCPNLKMVDIHSKILTVDDGNRLLKRFPDLVLMTVPCDICSSEKQAPPLRPSAAQETKNDGQDSEKEAFRISDHEFLESLYEDEYYPKHLVDKLKAVFLNLCQKIETTGPSTADEVERLCALSVEELNQLVTEFENERSDIDTDAREALADEFCTILEAYSLPYEHIERVLSNRTW